MESSQSAFGQDTFAFGDLFARPVFGPINPHCPACRQEVDPVMSGIPFACPYCDEVILLLPSGTMERMKSMPFPPGIAGVQSPLQDQP